MNLEQMIRSKLSLPSSESKNKPRNKPARNRQQVELYVQPASRRFLAWLSMDQTAF
jgi:hypothetical protein